jgi:sterol desaturase/sphingolipid hydroxylase (fatty acid hydroxylase superfamily)
MIASLLDLLGQAQGWLFETTIQPLLYLTGMGDIAEEAFEGTEWLLIGMAEMLLIYLVLRPLESAIPVHPVTDPRARWNDFIYTALQRLGLVPLVLFFTLDPVMDAIAGALHMEGVQPFNLENLVTDMHPLASFAIYLLVLDFADYWFHRAQHHFNWWWGLHSLHHSQQNMNLWSDDRNHLLDDLLRDIVMATLALAIGVPPSQYVLLVSLTRIVQSLQHANVRIHFGPIGERLLVSPRYHRMHHAIGVGHESAGQGTLGGCNFAVLFPIWDIVFRTANFTPRFEATGVRDQLAGRDYGRGFWAQQWLGVQRMIEYIRRKPG